MSDTVITHAFGCHDLRYTIAGARHWILAMMARMAITAQDHGYITNSPQQKLFSSTVTTQNGTNTGRIYSRRIAASAKLQSSVDGRRTKVWRPFFLFGEEREGSGGEGREGKGREGGEGRGRDGREGCFCSKIAPCHGWGAFTVLHQPDNTHW